MFSYPIIIEQPKDWIDYLSAFGPMIAAFIAIGIAVWQGIIQNRQHNLALFEKRWAFWEETKKLGYKTQTFKHTPADEMGDGSDPEKNFWIVGQEIQNLAKKGCVLFGKKIETEINEIAETFKKNHLLQERILEKLKYKDDYERAGKSIREELSMDFDNKMKLDLQHSQKWNELAQHIFDKIRELEV